MDKTYVFDTAESGGLNSSALIASLMQNKGVDPNLMAMLTNASKNQDAWGGSGCWFMWVILLFWLWGGNGYGNGFGRVAADGIPNQLNNDFGREVLLQAINNNFMAPQELVVDVVVNVNGNNITLQKLPASLDVADQGTANGSLFISTSRESMNTEITSLRQKSQDIINSIDYHKKVVQDCEVLLQRLNPEFAEQKQQKQEIDNLKAQMSEMMSGMKELMAQIKKETPKS